MEFGRFVAADHNARAIMAAARRWGGKHGRAASLMTIPAALGLVPVPGGALFSAPFVDQMTSEEHWAPEWKTAINYWFRHVWEYWWPIYPVTIVTLSIFQIETWQYMGLQIPLTLAAFFAGYFFLVRKHLNALAQEETVHISSARRALFIAIPLLLILISAIGLPFVFEPLIPAMGVQTRKLISILCGLAVALSFILWKEPKEKRHRLFDQLFTKKTMNILTSLGGVLVFKYMLEASKILPIAAEELLNSGIPILLVIALLPFIAGLVTGIAVAFAGTAFPLVAGLIASSNGELPLLSTVILAFTFGYAGMMLSPVHLCLLLTRDYFSATLAKTYRHLLPCVATVSMCGVLIHLLLRLGGL